tara:strand:- start:169 stop:561 length:393 start_codon:yes stop_codon:yes gene_type:complete
MFNTVSGRDDRDKVVITPPSSYETTLGFYQEDTETQQYDVETEEQTMSAENPSHYQKGVSPYDVAKSMYGAEGLLKFVTVNAIKYIQRFPHKYKGDPDKQLEDLIKAKRSLETAIELHTEIHGGTYIRHG